MTSLGKARHEPESQLWDEIEAVHAGMLGVEGINMHMQPMAPFVDRANRTIWFYTKTDSEIVQEIGPASRGRFCLVGKNHDYHACLCGNIEIRNDRSKIEEYWSSLVAAWYEHGKDDPKLVMLALRLDDAEIWASTGSTLKFGWEIARANLDEAKMPDIGVRQHLVFAGRA